MKLTDKLAIAIRVAYALPIFSTASIASELTDAGHPELADDEDFKRFLGERVFYCVDCEEWHDIGQRFEDTELCLACAESFYEELHEKPEPLLGLL